MCTDKDVKEIRRLSEKMIDESVRTEVLLEFIADELQQMQRVLIDYGRSLDGGSQVTS